MNLNPLPSTISRNGGCTLTGALAVTTSVRDSITIIHGPDGCSHHNFSLLHATLLDNDCMTVPRVMSSGLGEHEVIFGGEKALLNAIHRAAEEQPGIIFVLSTCITDTIGDDVAGICGHAGVPVSLIPGSGFLGGNFETGFSNALMALSDTIRTSTGPPLPGSREKNGLVNLIGEKNLEYEVEQNFAEIKRLLSLLDMRVHVRFVHKSSVNELGTLPDGSLNIIREPSLTHVGDYLQKLFGIPYVNSFPVGMTGTLLFIGETAKKAGISEEEPVQKERESQQQMLDEFSDLAGKRVSLPLLPGSPGYREICEVMDAAGLMVETGGIDLPVPIPFPVGTAGISRMLHGWRRVLS